MNNFYYYFSYSCSSGSYSSTYASSWNSFTYGYVVAGNLYNWPSNTYKSSIGVWSSCPGGESWNGQTSTSWGSTQVSSDGSCFNCPGDFTCSSSNLDSDSPCPAGVTRKIVSSLLRRDNIYKYEAHENSSPSLKIWIILLRNLYKISNSKRLQKLVNSMETWDQSKWQSINSKT